MYIVHVQVKVKPACINDFISATISNAEKSITEDGILSFDIIQQIDDPSRFVLIEVYRTDKDPGKHKDTAHYKIWRDKVESMMSEPRESQRYINLFPENLNDIQDSKMRKIE